MTKDYILVMLRRATATLAMLLAVSAPLLAQGSLATAITGHAVDPSGALIVGAKVTVTNNATNTSISVVTSAAGYYEVRNLIPGTYTVTAEMTGFKKEVRQNVQVFVGTETSAELTMTLGAVTEQVTVSGRVAPINPTSADMSTVVTDNLVSELPISVSGLPRVFNQFAYLTPGVTSGSGANNNTVAALGESIVNGGPSGMSDLKWDGMPFLNNDEAGAWLTRIPIEAIDEFVSTTATYDARNGRGIGFQDYHVRSGGNQIHGDVYELARNNAFDSRGHFASSVSVEKQNEYGGVVSGPVWIPKIYDGRDKTFFTFAYTGFRTRGGVVTSYITLPTAPMLTGDFTQFKDAAGNQIPIYDPATTAPDGSGGLTRQQFSCNGVLNEICPDRISTITSAFLPLVPTSVLPGSFNNAFTAASSPLNLADDMLKIDEHISNKSNFMFEYNRETYLYTESAPLITGPLNSFGEESGLAWQGRAVYTRTLTPNMVNMIGWGFMRYPSHLGAHETNTSVNTPISPLGFNYPAFQPAGYPDMGNADCGCPNGAWDDGTGLVDNLDWIKGRHSLHIGLDFRWLAEKKLPNPDWPGTYSFATATTSLPDSPNFTTWGSSWASFLLGEPAGIAQTAILGTGDWRSDGYAWYLQDDFHVSPKLTVNMGARYDIFNPSSEKYDRMAVFDPNVPNPGAGNIPGAVVYEGDEHGQPRVSAGGAATYRDRIADRHYGYVGPRIGLAYRLNDNTVIRSGYSLTYVLTGALSMWDGDTTASMLTGFRTSRSLSSSDGGITPVVDWDQGVPPLVLNVPSRTAGNNQSVDYMGRDAGRAGYIQQWSLSLQRVLPGRISIDAAYAGAKGTRMNATTENMDQMPDKYLSLGNLLGEDINSPDARAANIPIPYPGFEGSVSQALRPYPQYASITDNFQETGNYTYHALQVRAQKYYSNGLSFLVGYVASKNITNAWWGFGGFAATAMDTANRKLEKALSQTDLPQQLTVSGMYQLPIGPGKHFLNQKGPVGKVLGGWEVSYILGYQSGYPIAMAGGPALPNYGGSNRPNQNVGVPIMASWSGKFDPAVDVYLNKAAFSPSAPFTYGTVGPFLPSTRSFPYYNENVALSKRTYITEKTNIEFRADFFNLFNRTEYGAPDSNINDPTYGVINSQANLPREIQLTLKLNF